MLSVKGVYEKGKIRFLEQVKIKDDAKLIITFLDDDFPFSAAAGSVPDPEDRESIADAPIISKEDHPDEYYQKLRQHKRYAARGNITILEGDNDPPDELIYPLNDYSAGGLSFLSDRVFEVSKEITAALKYKAIDEVLAMNFEIIVRGVFEEEENRYKIGCQFLDQVDEELWHTIMGS